MSDRLAARACDLARDRMTAALRMLVSARTAATIEHMATALAQGPCDLNSRDAPIIFLSTMFADRELDFGHVAEAVSRAFEIRRDEASPTRRHSVADSAAPASLPSGSALPFHDGELPCA